MSYTQRVYNRFRQRGLTQAAALGLLGNFWCESNCEPFRLQGDFSPYRNLSHAYVQSVEDGTMPRESFARDGKGFGLYQLTYWTRKQGFFDFWKASGKALDDAELQVDYAIKEMENDYPQLLEFLKQTNDVFLATSKVCREFERPAINNIDARFQAAKRIQTEINLDAWEDGGEDAPEPSTPSTPSPGWELVPATAFWPPRTICKGMSGYDVMVLQSVLKARGWGVAHIDGEFGSFLEDVVKKFQTAYHLDVDGIVGPITWAKLLERG